MKRKYIDPPDDERCKATIKLRDGSEARCGRRRRTWDGDYCFQHEMLQEVIGPSPNPQPDPALVRELSPIIHADDADD